MGTTKPIDRMKAAADYILYTCDCAESTPPLASDIAIFRREATKIKATLETLIDLAELFEPAEEPPPPQDPSAYTGVEGFVRDLKCTIRECIDCGCLTPGGPTRCKRCANESARVEGPEALEKEGYGLTGYIDPNGIVQGGSVLYEPPLCDKCGSIKDGFHPNNCRKCVKEYIDALQEQNDAPDPIGRRT